MITLSFDISLDSFSLHLDETLPASGITAVFGRSGAGKTSLINAVSGLITPRHGRISLGEKALFDSGQQVNLPPEKRRVGYVFQDARLFPHMTVEKNLRYGEKRNQPSVFKEIVALLDIETLLNRYPRDLSGGEKQRVAIGRALMAAPELLIMDEPTASLDAPRRQELISYLLLLVEKLKVPVLYVSHSLDEILQLADNMLILDRGHVVANGPIHEVWGSEPMRPWLSAKEQSMLVMATVMGHHENYAMTQLDLEGQSLWVQRVQAEKGARMRLRIFANDISIVKTKPTDSSIRNVIPVEIADVMQCDSGNGEAGYCQLALKIGQQTLLANITQWAADELSLAQGQRVYAQLKGVSVAKGDSAPTH